MIEFLKLAKSSRVGGVNAMKIHSKLWLQKKEVRLSKTAFYEFLYLRPNQGDWLAFEQVFRYLSYGELVKLKPINTVIDAGANIGLSSVYFDSQLGKPDIYAIEPESGNFEQAKKNTAHLKNVTLEKRALWHSDGEVLEICNKETSGSLGFCVDSAKSETGIASITIPTILEANNWDFVDLLKIDIEGAEKQIFEGQNCDNWLSRVKILAIELHDFVTPGCSMPFFKALSRMSDIEFRLAGENLIIINHSICTK